MFPLLQQLPNTRAPAHAHVCIISFQIQYMCFQGESATPATDRIRLSSLPDFGFRPQTRPTPLQASTRLRPCTPSH